MMTRKDYEIIACAIRDSKPHNPSPCAVDNAAFYAWEGVIDKVAFSIAAMNPNFDSGRFKRRCRETVKEPS